MKVVKDFNQNLLLQCSRMGGRSPLDVARQNSIIRMLNGFV